jgi:hypothetical protein
VHLLVDRSIGPAQHLFLHDRFCDGSVRFGARGLLEDCSFLANPSDLSVVRKQKDTWTTHDM